MQIVTMWKMHIQERVGDVSSQKNWETLVWLLELHPKHEEMITDLTNRSLALK